MNKQHRIKIKESDLVLATEALGKEIIRNIDEEDERREKKVEEGLDPDWRLRAQVEWKLRHQVNLFNRLNKRLQGQLEGRPQDKGNRVYIDMSRVQDRVSKTLSTLGTWERGA